MIIRIFSASSKSLKLRNPQLVPTFERIYLPKSLDSTKKNGCQNNLSRDKSENNLHETRRSRILCDYHLAARLLNRNANITLHPVYRICIHICILHI